MRRPSGCSRRPRRRRRWAKLTVKQIEKLIYPVSFYRYKARYIKATCAKLMKDFGGKTPSTMEELLTLPGVGRKTANLVLILAYESRKNICVDTHVHRIANRLGWVRTKTPDETEQALYRATEVAMVAVHQSLSRHVGTERVPAGVSTMPGVRHQGLVPAHRRDGRQQDEAGELSFGSVASLPNQRGDGYPTRLSPVPSCRSTTGVVLRAVGNAGDPGPEAAVPASIPAGSSPFSAETLPCRPGRRVGWMHRRSGTPAPGRGTRTTISTHDCDRRPRLMRAFSLPNVQSIMGALSAAGRALHRGVSSASSGMATAAAGETSHGRTSHITMTEDPSYEPLSVVRRQSRNSDRSAFLEATCLALEGTQVSTLLLAEMSRCVSPVRR